MCSENKITEWGKSGNMHLVMLSSKSLFSPLRDHKISSKQYCYSINKEKAFNQKVLSVSHPPHAAMIWRGFAEYTKSSMLTL